VRRDTPPKPYPAIRVGVVGHRLTALVDGGTDIGVLRTSVHAVLEQIHTAARTVADQNPAVFAGPPRLRVISPLAEGTDQIVADEALRSGYLLHVPLPCLPAIYSDAFQDPKAWAGEDSRAAFTRLLNQAGSVQVVDGAPGAVLDDAAYAAVGRTVLRHSDVLIAVWDGAPAAGPGGTAEVVAQARLWGVPIVRVDPRHPERWTFEANTTAHAGQDLEGSIRDLLQPPIEDQAAARSSQLKQYLVTRPAWGIGGIFVMLTRFFADYSPPLQLTTLGRASIDRAREEWAALWDHADRAIGDPLNAALEEYYVWAAGLGNRFGTLHRDASSAPYILAPLAVFLALVAHWWTPALPWLNPQVVGLIEVLVLSGIVATYKRAVGRHYHDRWIDYRSLAEELRQLAFLWPLGRPLPAVELIGETEGEAPQFAWVGWYARSVVRDLGLCPGVWTPEQLTSLRQLLVDRFIGNQIDYHTRTAARFERVSERLHRGTATIFVFALAIAVAHITVYGNDSLFGAAVYRQRPLFVTDAMWGALGIIGAVLAIVLPALGAALHGFLSQGDFWNLARRSQRMCDHLKPLATEMAHTPAHIEPLGVAAEKAAGVMRDEVVYWRVFVRLKPPALV
jgi:hypothetical protein